MLMKGGDGWDLYVVNCRNEVTGIITEYLSTWKDSEWSATHSWFVYSYDRSTFSGGEYGRPSLNSKDLPERTDPPYPGSSPHRQHACGHFSRCRWGQRSIAARPTADERRRQPAAGQRVRGDGSRQPDQPKQHRDRHERGPPGSRIVRGRELRRRRDLDQEADRGQRQPGRRLLRPQPVLRSLRQPLPDLPLQRRGRGSHRPQYRRR